MAAITEPSYSHGIYPTALIGETIGTNLREVATAFPGNEALVDVPSGRRWTYGQLDSDTDAVALGLLGLGIGQGDRVGIWAPNCAEWVLTQYATAKIGAILVNINPAYRSHELGYVLGQSGVRLLVSAESFKTSDYRAMVEEVRGGGGSTGWSGSSTSAPRTGTTWWRRGRSRWPRAARPSSSGAGPHWPSTTRSTSSTPAGPPASPRAPRCPTTTS